MWLSEITAAESHKPTSVYHLSHRSTDMYSQIYVYIAKYLYLAKKCGVGRALDRRATRAAHFNGVVQLALGVDRFRGALELPETWEIVGPTRPRAHLSQSASADRLTRPRHPFGPVVALRSGHCVPLSTATTDVLSIRPYISYLLSRSMR